MKRKKQDEKSRKEEGDNNSCDHVLIQKLTKQYSKQEEQEVVA
jgi:hypothetical protein